MLEDHTSSHHRLILLEGLLILQGHQEGIHGRLIGQRSESVGQPLEEVVEVGSCRVAGECGGGEEGLGWRSELFRMVFDAFHAR